LGRHRIRHRPSSGVGPAELDALLQDSVRDRLESEVPLGAFLSGGIDSGLVVSAMSQALATPPITAAVGFSHAAHNELQAAGQTAAHCQTKHFQHVIEPDLDKVLDPIVRSFDEPFADASAIPTYYVSAVARRHVTVALSGDGGDEAFGGYSARYVPHGVESIARDYWAGARGRRSAGWVGARWPRWRSLPRPLRLGGVLENLGTDAANAYYRDHCIMKPAVARRLVGGPLISDIADQPGYRAMAGPYLHCPSDAVQRAQYADLKTYLASNVLVKVDRMSMANSLEVRCPLLDRRIIELAFRIPVARKMPWLRPKHLLRRLARQRLPVQIQRRPKHGFTAPAGEWIAGACAWRFREEVLGRSSHVASWLDLGVVRGLFDGHTTGEADHGRALWAIWMLERWSRVTHGAAAHAAPAAVKECA
jgi:asparagine synthase (glutamine-hydrolysing)